MSGKRHHFIPQFIQRGFASHQTNTDAYTWVYRAGKSPFNTNIKNVGVEGGFYSGDDSSTVDDSITLAENELARLVSDLRQAPDSPVAAATEVARLVGHLEVRSRNLRRNFEHIGNVALRQVLDFLSDEDRFGRYMVRQLERNDSVLLKAIEDDLRQRGLPIALAPAALKLAKPLLPRLIPSTAADFAAMAAKMRDQAATMVQAAARSGQLRGLASAIAPSERERKYAAFRYRTVTLAHARMPLGDSMVLFHIDGDRGYRSFTQADDQVLAAFLPLSPSKVLVGQLDQYHLDEERLPSAIAACSLEHYIADAKSEQFEVLSEHLGASATVLTEEEVEALMSDAFNSLP